MPAALETARAGPSSILGPALGYPRVDPGFSQGRVRVSPMRMAWDSHAVGRSQGRRTFKVGSSDLTVLSTFDL